MDIEKSPLSTHMPWTLPWAQPEPAQHRKRRVLRKTASVLGWIICILGIAWSVSTMCQLRILSIPSGGDHDSDTHHLDGFAYLHDGFNTTVGNPGFSTQSTASDEEDLKKGDVVCNVLGSTDDQEPHWWEEGQKSTSWIQVWKDVTGWDGKDDEIMCSVGYDLNGHYGQHQANLLPDGSPDAQHPAGVGGHVIKEDTPVTPGDGDSGVFLVPLCSHHNALKQNGRFKLYDDVSAVELTNYCKWQDEGESGSCGNTRGDVYCEDPE